MKSIHAISLVLIGIIVGCGAAAVAPTAASWAETEPSSGGDWACYVVDRFPDVDEAQSWDAAMDISEGLNQVARRVASGTALPLIPKGGMGESYPSVVCIKD